MTGFVAAHWNPADTDAGHRAHVLVAGVHARKADARAIVDKPGWTVLVWNDPLARSASVDGRGAIVGTVFGPNGLDGSDLLACQPLAEASDFHDACTLLSKRCWGAYVLLWADDANQSAFVFRDPIGTLDGVSWEDDGLRIITSDAVTCQRAARSAQGAIDWRRVRAALAAPATMLDAPLLTGRIAIVPGETVEFRGRSWTRRTVWNAAAVAAAPSDIVMPADMVRSTVQACVRQWSAGLAEIGCEISGGFDSSVVAATLAPGSRLRAGYHYFTDDGVGDERPYARAVAGYLDVPLVETLMPMRALVQSDLDDLPVGNRPAIGAVSLFHDRDLAARARDAGVTALFTGQGGDALFFQHPAVELAAECRGVRELAALSRWTKQSVWSTLLRRSGLRGRREPRDAAHPFLSRELQPAIEASAWSGDTGRLSPAKRRHVEALHQSRLAFGVSWTGAVMDVVHPLLSQPIVETVLALPVMTLTEGFRDRGLARRAFAPDLPTMVTERYGKGALTPYFGRRLARSLPFLREYLLDGVLADHHVVERGRLEPLLDVDALMQHDIYPELLWLILAEHWARGWSAILAPGERERGRAGVVA